MQDTTTCKHEYKFDKDASDSTRVVTICSHCGDSVVKLTLADIPQMDIWTKPPSKWLHKPSNIMDRVIN